MPTIRAVLKEGTARLRTAEIASAALDARLLLQHVLDQPHEHLVRFANQLIPKKSTQEYEALIARRAQGEPISCITGIKEFWSMEFRTSPHTLDPRPDSETLVEAVLCHVERSETSFHEKDPSATPQDDIHILDIGTGTGCLLLALLSELPQARGTGVDISPEALDTARDNAERLGFAGRVEFIRSDWCAELSGTFDLIVSNPPYIPSAEIAHLSREVREYDPLAALDGGADGLDAYRALIPQTKKLLAPDGLLLLEIGQAQEKDVAALLEASGLKVKEFRKDLAGTVRCLVARHASSSTTGT